MEKYQNAFYGDVLKNKILSISDLIYAFVLSKKMYNKYLVIFYYFIPKLDVRFTLHLNKKFKQSN